MVFHVKRRTSLAPTGTGTNEYGDTSQPTTFSAQQWCKSRRGSLPYVLWTCMEYWGIIHKQEFPYKSPHPVLRSLFMHGSVSHRSVAVSSLKCTYLPQHNVLLASLHQIVPTPRQKEEILRKLNKLLSANNCCPWTISIIILWPWSYHHNRRKDKMLQNSRDIAG